MPKTFISSVLVFYSTKAFDSQEGGRWDLWSFWMVKHPELVAVMFVMSYPGWCVLCGRHPTTWQKWALVDQIPEN
jgi:hypothetical protein